MIEVIYFLVFFFSIAAATGAILLSGKLKAVTGLPAFESYLYYIILFILFGFYGIWGKVITHYLLSELSASSVVVIGIGHLVPLLGYPFLIMGGYMLIRTGYELFNSRMRFYASIFFSLVNLILLAGFGWLTYAGLQHALFNRSNPLYLLLLLYLALDTFSGSWFMLKGISVFREKRNMVRKDRTTRFLIVFAISQAFKISAGIFIYIFPVLSPVFILFYFLSIVAPAAYLYKTSSYLIGEVKPDFSPGNTRDRLHKKYGITKREREIIDQICSGKSNQEIADTLFISLQTVKDHTHRIYLKTEVKSRIQLMTVYQNAE